jgi:hypothetical protein
VETRQEKVRLHVRACDMVEGDLSTHTPAKSANTAREKMDKKDNHKK